MWLRLGKPRVLVNERHLAKPAVLHDLNNDKRYILARGVIIQIITSAERFV